MAGRRSEDSTDERRSAQRNGFFTSAASGGRESLAAVLPADANNRKRLLRAAGQRQEQDMATILLPGFRRNRDSRRRGEEDPQDLSSEDRALPKETEKLLASQKTKRQKETVNGSREAFRNFFRFLMLRWNSLRPGLPSVVCSKARGKKRS
jgi:hypothetical protein